MPISLNITQPTGVVATYHVINGGAFGQTSLTARVNSYLSQTTFAAGDLPVSSVQVDCSAVLGVAAPTPPTGATTAQAVFGIVEGFLIAQQTPNPDGSLTNGTFYGGTIVS